jgi:hypothetical protein
MTTDETRALLKRLIDDGTDKELEAVRKKLMRKGTNVCTAKQTPSATWLPKNREIARQIIQLLKSDVGLRTADVSYNVQPNERSMKILCSEIVERLRYREGLEGNAARPTTSALSIAVASVLARVVEEANAMSASTSTLVEKNARTDAPSWGTISAKGSGCSLNTDGYTVFKKALETIDVKLRGSHLSFKPYEPAVPEE